MGAWKHGKLFGAIVVIVTLLYIYSSIEAQWASMKDDLRLAFTMIFFVWVLNWARKNLGSPRLAILYALVIAYLIFFKHPETIWWIVGIVLLAVIGPKFFAGLDTSGPKKDPFLEALKEMKPTVVLPMAPPFPYYYYGWYNQQQRGGNQGGST